MGHPPRGAGCNSGHTGSGDTRHRQDTGSSLSGGADLREVWDRLQRLRGQGLRVSLDRLGEAVVSEPEADRYLRSYLGILNYLHEKATEGADPQVPNLSIKVSSLYSRITPRDPEGSAAGILARLRPLLRVVRDQGASICLDMEQYDYKPVTLEVFRRLISDPEFADWDGLGVALQAYLPDTERDLNDILHWAVERAAPFTVRLVRGAYWDQEVVLAQREGWSIPVWPHKDQTDRLFERCLGRLLKEHAHVHTAVATHNVRSLALAMVLAEQHGTDTSHFEFQMLYGMGESLHTAVAELGYTVRIYVPFGELLPGMAYLVRRLLGAVASLRIGSPAAPGTDMGPVIDAAAKVRIGQVIEQAKAVATLAMETDVSPLGSGFFVGPTVFTEVPPDAALAQEEIFGPVLAIMKAQDFTHALALANNTRFALVGRQPFGGFRMSGIGSKTGGPDYLPLFTQPRSITENTLRRGYAPSTATAQSLSEEGRNLPLVP